MGFAILDTIDYTKINYNAESTTLYRSKEIVYYAITFRIKLIHQGFYEAAYTVSQFSENLHKH